MQPALTILTVVATVALVVIAAWLVTRLVSMIAELRKVTTGLNVVLGWARGHVSADISSHAVVDGAPPNRRGLGSG